MEYKKPTYEEYSKASEFAKLRYRYGVYFQLIALVLFLFLCVYTVTNIEEMKANPKDYAEKKLGVECRMPFTIIMPEDYTQNGSNRNIRSIGSG